MKKKEFERNFNFHLFPNEETFSLYTSQILAEDFFPLFDNKHFRTVSCALFFLVAHIVTFKATIWPSEVNANEHFLFETPQKNPLWFTFYEFIYGHTEFEMRSVAFIVWRVYVIRYLLINDFRPLEINIDLEWLKSLEF